jgi:uncharacterized membrane protein (UPF0127 family)
LMGGCPTSKTPHSVPVYFPDGSHVSAELAQRDEDRQRGLMYRERIKRNEGMLFVFKREGFYDFWMKNVSFPIDILWLDGERRILHIQAQAPPCDQGDCPSYSSPQPALFVLELKAGEAERRGLKLNDRLDFVL